MTSPTDVSAATELLIRAFYGRFARLGHAWIHREDDGWCWIEWEAIPDGVVGLSGGERRLLLLAASLAGVQVRETLGDLISGLDRPTVGLVLAAPSHTAGTHEHTEYLIRVLDEGRGVIDPATPRLDLGPLYPWPDPGAR